LSLLSTSVISNGYDQPKLTVGSLLADAGYELSGRDRVVLVGGPETDRKPRTGGKL
jgi:hypothetical protein